MKFIKKYKNQELTLCFIISGTLNNIILKKISTKIKNYSKSNYLIFIYIETKNRYFTILPLTKIVSPGENLSNIKNLIKEKLKLFENQYNFEADHFTIFCKLIVI
uniref:Orf314 n=1 Tax=Cyanea capillata TaxID=27804 RepID=G9ISF9_CYACP|nr:orf314 [Cyanea capillata]